MFEDLHWIDTETQGFLDTFTDSVASANLLLLVNYRPEYKHEWGQKTYYRQLRLGPLGKAEADELLTFLLGTDASLTALKPLVLEKTEGTPFFVEEVVQTLAEEGVLRGGRGNYSLEATPTELHISPTVQGVLAARIDRLTAEEKELLQQLSVIGRQFPVSLVEQVVSQPEADLYRVLSSLQSKEFLYEQPAFPEVEYLFKHVLTQDVAYRTVLQEQRKGLHERTGQGIESLYTDSLDDHYSELATHYSRSGNTEKAIEYLYLAGEQASQRSANEEAASYLTEALALLKTLPDTPTRSQQELMLLVTLGSTLLLTKGWGAEEVKTVLTRAQELCHYLGETGPPNIIFGLWVMYFSRAEYAQARAIGEQFRTLAHATQNSAYLLGACYTVGANLYQVGEPMRAREQLDHAISLYDRQQAHTLLALYPTDLGVEGRSMQAVVLWLLGYPEQGLQRSQEALSLAQELAHPFSLAFAMSSTALLHQFRRERQAVQDRAEAVIALAEQEHGGAGLSQLREGLAAWWATGAELWRSQFLAVLAEAYGKDEQVEEGLSTVAEALAFVERTEERYYEAELYRLQGELTLQADKRSPEAKGKEAAACFHKAIEVARSQQAKSWELRAATSLARLWQQQGKRAEVHELLAPVYEWFTEGFDTADLKDAKILLGVLI